MEASVSTVSPPQVNRSRGRGLFWLGIAACLLGLGLAALLMAMKVLREPWYAPILATLGALLLLASLVKRFTIVRLVALVLVTVLACFQWFALLALARLPEYQGPV